MPGISSIALLPAPSARPSIDRAQEKTETGRQTEEKRLGCIAEAVQPLGPAARDQSHPAEDRGQRPARCHGHGRKAAITLW